ncbi:DivIVA domain-containing protein [Rothia mucilaginosa]|jgi:divIVA family protein|uniref:DivIVA domain-containing protein n=1 Tax=Rothia TaxID=32207 RepID=UPI00066BE146|nr:MULTISPECIES: DivIVA domain-containing protein [Rothia]MDU2571390.1 DivIVA domain-containing protein [Rothia mucilaginosa]OFJ75097.1 cell division protein DivIVA [Rothia sp. HMSC065B04]OFL53643.1 cell division protein DivIVA [Rothia sp. HMSC062H08]OFL78077.1 cell division protein DivIVA [Rothia sp. HMSC075F09]OFQ34142.1 cell division protein DivIVA [Rothia sp. HMSC071C12]
MAITPEDLITKSFKIVTEESGYDRNEVDDFLDELVVELRALYSERDALERQVEQLSANAPDSPAAAVAPAQSSAAPAAAPQDAAALLAMAQKVHDDYVAQGEKAKAELIEEAERKADAMVSEAQQQREEVLSRLTDEKEELEIAVEALRGFESRYRSKLLQHLDAQVQELKNLKSIEASA